MAALVEVHDADEARRAAVAGAGLVGVNNRDLATFRVDLTTAERLRSLLPESAVAVAESGVSGPEAASRMAAAGYDAILVGEALVRSDDPAGLVASLREAGT
jgi:indole-3-glycerol phosphate synthase